RACSVGDMEELITAIGTFDQSLRSLIASKISSPPCFGRFRSSTAMSGTAPSRTNDIAAAPSAITINSATKPAAFSAWRRRYTSASLSSTSNIRIACVCGLSLIDLLLRQWQSEIECAALMGRRINPDTSAIAFHHALADGKTDARARDGLSMEPLKDSENRLMIFWLNSHAVIAHSEAPVRQLLRYLDVNPRR